MLSIITSVVYIRLAFRIVLSYIALFLIDLIFDKWVYIALVLIGVILFISTNLGLEMLY